MTNGAKTPNFQRLWLHIEPMTFAACLQYGADHWVVDLGDGSALTANQQLCVVIFFPMRARHKSIKCFHPMHETRLDKKIERPVDGRR